MWETFKFWQAQQALAQQTGPGSGLWGSRQAQQAKAAWNTWKFWQAQQAQLQQAQVQQPSQAPPQAAQPTQPSPAHPAAQAQPAPGGPGAVQKYKFYNVADWNRQRTADPTTRHSRYTDPPKNGWSGNSSVEPGTEPSGNAAPAKINLFRARPTVTNLSTIHASSKSAGPIGSGPANQPPPSQPAVRLHNLSHQQLEPDRPPLRTPNRAGLLHHMQAPSLAEQLTATWDRFSTADKQPFELGWAAVV